MQDRQFARKFRHREDALHRIAENVATEGFQALFHFDVYIAAGITLVMEAMRFVVL